MFDFDLGKLLLIGVVALIFIPPKDLPGALRQLGRLMGQARRMASDFRAQFDEALRESDLHELKDEFNQIRDKASIEGAMNRIADMMEVEKPATAAPAEPEPTAKIEPAAAENQMIEKADLPPPTESKPEQIQ